jgi:hypothetical protein
LEPLVLSALVLTRNALSSPAFNAAGLYLILGEIIRLLGQRYCKLEPRTYVWIFCVGDFLSLLIQAAGGGIAATAATVDMADLGA